MRNRFGLEGKVALITGAAQRLGLEIAQSLSQEGMIVFIADIQKDKGEEAVEVIRLGGGRAHFVYLDLSDPVTICKMVNEIWQITSRIDLLVNNAKAPSKQTLENISKKEWDLSMDVIVSGAFFCAREVIPKMGLAGKGCIINVLSVAANVVCNESVAYHVAKAGISQLTRYLACYAGPLGVRVNGISPGFIIKEVDRNRYEADEQWKKRWEWCHPLRRPGYGTDISNAILFLASDLAGFITGQTLVVDGGLTLVDPGTLVNEYSKAIRQNG
ncbi:MAG: SDR family oxidoreductase [Chlamydiae bacterium]|nr:SDR family oxidoreductase [Chlamydiota bacterium]